MTIDLNNFQAWIKNFFLNKTVKNNDYMLHHGFYALCRHESCDTSIMDYLMVCRQYHFDNPDTKKELQFVLRFFQRLIKALFYD